MYLLFPSARVINDIYCGGEFPLQVIRRSIHTTNESVCLNYKCKILNITQKADEDTIFLCGNPNWEKSWGEAKFTIIRRFTETSCMYWCFFELGSSGRPGSFLLEKVCLY